MAPTLQDVSFLLGLPLAGQPVGPLEAPLNWEADLIDRFDGIFDGAPALQAARPPRRRRSLGPLLLTGESTTGHSLAENPPVKLEHR